MYTIIALENILKLKSILLMLVIIIGFIAIKNTGKQTYSPAIKIQFSIHPNVGMLHTLIIDISVIRKSFSIFLQREMNLKHDRSDYNPPV